jgi:hypothetical protein
MSTRTTLTALTASAALLASGVAAGAGAGQSQYATVFKKFELQASTQAEQRFSGKIDSRKSRCRGDRPVKAYRKRDGERQKLGGDATNDKGKFSIGLGDGRPKPGKYFARAPEVHFKADSGTKISCLEASSPTVEIQ